MIVGEVSGDALGAALIQALQQLHPECQFQIEGIVGPKLINQGAKALYPMDTLNVMGIFEPLKRLPKLWRIRKELYQRFIANPPDVFIGIDAPDFNLGLEKKLRAQGIKTVHYVSPTIWAWRAGRIKQIKKAVNLMLALFPFEQKIYEAQDIPVCYVGHPFADEIPLEIDAEAAKRALGFDAKDTLIALLPGSRDKELYYLAKSYIETAQCCFRARRDLKFVMPVVSEKHHQLILNLLRSFPADPADSLPPIKIITENPRLAMAACDVALVTSGTATLEMMLHKKPMIVAYRMNPITYQIAKRLIKLPYIAMANIVAEEKLAPEFIQEAVIPEQMAECLIEMLKPTEQRANIIQRYTDLHRNMRKNASVVAARAVAKQLGI